MLSGEKFFQFYFRPRYMYEIKILQRAERIFM